MGFAARMRLWLESYREPFVETDGGSSPEAAKGAVGQIGPQEVAAAGIGVPTLQHGNGRQELSPRRQLRPSDLRPLLQRGPVHGHEVLPRLARRDPHRLNDAVERDDGASH